MVACFHIPAAGRAKRTCILTSHRSHPLRVFKQRNCKTWLLGRFEFPKNSPEIHQSFAGVSAERAVFAGLSPDHTRVHTPNPMTQEPHIFEEQVMIPMRDGTRLAASIMRPASGQPVPAVLIRTPYDKTAQRLQQNQWADAGYAFVRQDVRGRFDSEGEFYPFRNDPDDGFDTVEWIAAQPWCDGNVGQTGASHVGTVQYLVAPAAPPHLRAAAPEFAPASVYHYWWWQQGAFRLSFNLSWMVLLASDNLRHYPKRSAALEEARQQVWVSPEEMKALSIKPLFREWTYQDFAPLTGVFGNDWYSDFMRHNDYGPFWQPYDFHTQHADMDIPMLHAAGWYDTFVQGTLDSFIGLWGKAKSERARAGQKLIVGPWQHVTWGRSTVGDLDFGAPLMSVPPFEYRKRWFDCWLKGEANGFLNEPPVHIFVMGENLWRHEDEWPLSRARRERLYLHSDGSLDRTEPGSETPRHYSYDPRDPVITLGGCEWVNYPCGPYDQAPLDGRPDVLSFLTEPLHAPLEVTGQVFAHIFASTDARDTDFTAKLVDVWPDGRAFNICDGIVRATYRDSTTSPSFVESGRPYEFVVDLWSTSIVFGAGHRLRLDVSSSNFPRFDANPNTGFASFTPEGREKVVAHNTIYFDREHPSYLELPVIPRA
jgi:putative CocE/NonD family hydrolase